MSQPGWQTESAPAPLPASAVSGPRLRESLQGRIRDRHVLAAMAQVPRERFLDDSYLPFASDVDAALPIGREQTTSAPFIIARMLQMLLAGRTPPLKILEIGSGCGYQTAILAQMGCEVIGIERIGALARAAARRLHEMGHRNASIRHGDGAAGAPDAAPFDGIVICAECAAAPPQLTAQLTADGALVLPLRRGAHVTLTALDSGGAITARREKVFFVPFLEGAAA